MNTFYFLESERHQELDIRCSIRIMCQFIMVMITIMVIAKS